MKKIYVKETGGADIGDPWVAFRYQNEAEGGISHYVRFMFAEHWFKFEQLLKEAGYIEQ